MGNVAGNFWRKMTGPRPIRGDESSIRTRQSRQSQNNRARARNSSSINEQLTRPLLQQNKNTRQRTNVKAIQPIQPNQLTHSGRLSIKQRNQEATFERSSIKSHADKIQQQNNPVSPASSVVQPTLPITSNHNQNQRENRPQVVAQPQEYPIQHKMNVYCFKKSRNIIQIHQRHATTCANVLNK
jgi:hypothetical protein